MLSWKPFEAILSRMLTNRSTVVFVSAYVADAFAAIAAADGGGGLVAGAGAGDSRGSGGGGGGGVAKKRKQNKNCKFGIRKHGLVGKCCR